MALSRSMHQQDTREVVRLFRSRLMVVTWCVGVVLLLLAYRLFVLQIQRGEELSRRGRRNYVQQIEIPHDRGIIYDRFGNILVDNRPSLDVQVTPAFLGKGIAKEQSLARLADLVQLTPEEYGLVRDAVRASTGLSAFKPLLVKRDLDPQQVEAVESERSVFRLDGVDIVEGRRRTYPYGKLASHILGYVNEIDPTALESERIRGNPLGYQGGDMIGRDGIERSFEEHLRGADGYDQVVVDAKGRRQRDAYVEAVLGAHRRVEPRPGHNVYLTLDLALQQRVETAFTGQAGAVVVMEAKTGALLAMASFPSFDPNLVSGTLAKKTKAELDADPLKPWINRAIQGQYAPGSTFKVATALAALRERVASKTETVYCPGSYRMGRHTWRCHKDSGHGHVNLHDALKLSCDVYFYTMAGRMGLNPIADAARLLGFGARTGLPLRGEKPGVAPDEQYHRRVDAATGGYQKGMAVNASIGQGAVLVTPLQLARAYGAIANGGHVWVPQLIDRIESADFRIVRRYLPEAREYWPWLAGAGAAAGANADGENSDDANDDSTVSNDIRPLRAAMQNEGAAIQVQQQPSRVTQYDAEHGTDGDSGNSSSSDQSTVMELVVGKPSVVLVGFAPKNANAEDQALPMDLMQWIQDGLVAVTSEPGGTAYWHRSKKVSMAGKTGTAQVVRLGTHRFKPEEIPYFSRDHAWFVAYAPAEDPEIAVAVLNEHSGHGGSMAAPIAVAAIDAYFELKQLRQAQAARALQAIYPDYYPNDPPTFDSVMNPPAAAPSVPPASPAPVPPAQ